MLAGIERSIVRLDLDAQGEFIALINAIEFQLETGRPVVRVVKLLSDALLELAPVRGMDPEKLRLKERLDALLDRIRKTPPISDDGR